MSCSATLRRAAERFQHSARLISDSAAVEFDREGADGRLSVDLNTGGRQPIYQTIDTMLAGLFMLCEWILTVPITPIEVTFRHRKPADDRARSEEHTSELQSLMRISYAVFCLKKKKTYKNKSIH